MTEFWAQLPVLGRVFAVCAFVSSAFFFVRIILMFVGADADADVDVDVSGDFEFDSGAAFEVLSVNTIVAFLMMFGWIGLACYVQFSMSATMSLCLAFVAGIFSMLTTAFLFKAAKKLSSGGAKFSVTDLVGSVGSVYQEIPKSGRGRIQIKSKNGMQREIDAVSKGNEEIASFVNVKVVDVIDDETVVVESI